MCFDAKFVKFEAFGVFHYPPVYHFMTFYGHTGDIVEVKVEVEVVQIPSSFDQNVKRDCDLLPLPHFLPEAWANKHML